MGVGSLTERASKLVDVWLKSHVESLSSYVRDAPHLLQILDDVTVPSEAFLVSFDIECLYNSIPHGRGVKMVKIFPWSDGIRLGPIVCLPVSGGGWGCRESSLFTGKALIAWISNIVLWYRYIENVFAVWGGSREDLELFLKGLDKNAFNLKFTYTYSQSTVSFLDISIPDISCCLVYILSERIQTVCWTSLKLNTLDLGWTQIRSKPESYLHPQSSYLLELGWQEGICFSMLCLHVMIISTSPFKKVKKENREIRAWTKSMLHTIY